MTDILRAKEIIQRATFGIPNGMKKECNFYFYCFSIDILIRNIISEEPKTQRLFEKILHVEFVKSPQSWKEKQFLLRP